MSPRFDWPGLMRAMLAPPGGLSPERFWALTPAELRLILGARAGPPPMGRARLDALMHAFPDLPKETRP
ncbi:phage tail assembly chaperone [Roseivivax sp.]